MRGLRYISHCIYKGNHTVLRPEFKAIPSLFFLTNPNAFGVQFGVHFGQAKSGVQRSRPLARVWVGVKPNGKPRAKVQAQLKLATHQRENSNDTWRAGRWDDCRAGQTCRTDAARHRAADSSGSPKSKVNLPDAADAQVKPPTKSIYQPPRPIRIGSATVSVSSSKPFP